MAINLPLEQPVVLHPDPDDSARQVAAALAAFQAGQSTASVYRAQLNAIAARYPTCLNAWAALGELALPDDVIAAYAFFRVGYHRYPHRHAHIRHHPARSILNNDADRKRLG